MHLEGRNDSFFHPSSTLVQLWAWKGTDNYFRLNKLEVTCVTLPLCTTTEVTSACTLLPIFYRWKPGLREAKQLGQGLLNQKAGFLIPRLILSSPAFERGNNSSLRGGMRILRTLEDRGTCWKCLGEATVKLSGILWEPQEVPE